MLILVLQLVRAQSVTNAHEAELTLLRDGWCCCQEVPIEDTLSVVEEDPLPVSTSRLSLSATGSDELRVALNRPWAFTPQVSDDSLIGDVAPAPWEVARRRDLETERAREAQEEEEEIQWYLGRTREEEGQ
jgi:hypothetical protein